MFKARHIEEDRILDVYAIDYTTDAFLVDYDGKFKWKQRTDFAPISRDDNFHIIYRCDRRGCNGKEGCDNPECSYTSKIEHAVNFHKVLEGFYEENGVNVDV